MLTPAFDDQMTAAANVGSLHYRVMLLSLFSCKCPLPCQAKAQVSIGVGLELEQEKELRCLRLSDFSLAQASFVPTKSNYQRFPYSIKFSKNPRSIHLNHFSTLYLTLIPLSLTLSAFGNAGKILTTQQPCLP